MPSRRQQLTRNSFLNLMGQVLPLVVAIVALPIVVKGLGDARFGLLSLAWTFLGYFNFFDLGLGRAATRFIAAALGRGDSDGVPAILVTALSAQLLFGTVAAIIMAVGTPFIVPMLLDSKTSSLAGEALIVLRLVALGMPIVMVSSSLSGALEAAQRFDIVNVVRIPANTASFLLPLVGVLLGMSLPGIVLLLLLGRLSAMLGYAFFVRRILGSFGTRHANVGMLREMLGFGGWIMVSGLTAPILVYSERLILASKLSLAALTYYALPFEIVSRSAILPSALALTLYPAFSFFENASRAHLTELYSRPLKYLVVILAPVLLFFLAFTSDILQHWLGAAFVVRSADAMRVIAAIFFLNGLAQVSLAAVQGLGRPDLKAKFDVLATPVFIALVLLLVPRYGITGAAVAKLLVTILDVCVLFYCVGIASKGRIKGVFPAMAGLAVSTLAYLVVGTVAVHMAGNFGMRVAGFLLVSALFTAAVLRWHTDAMDRQALRRGWETLRAVLKWRLRFGRA